MLSFGLSRNFQQRTCAFAAWKPMLFDREKRYEAATLIFSVASAANVAVMQCSK
jgi:hypothetical protein